MKNKTSNEKMANGQQSQDIQNTPAIKFQITVHGNSAPGIFPAMLPPFAARLGTDGCNNTIRCHHIGKAPPGRARAPGRARGHPPANKAGPPNQSIQEQIASPLSFKREGLGVSSKTTLNINNPIFNTEKTIIFLNILNFKIMKKQILILALFVMAMFASVTKTYGQCVSDPLKPAAGVPYDYEVTIQGTTGTLPNFLFYVTKDKDVKGGTKETEGTDFAVTTGTGYAAYSTAGANGKIKITWTSNAVASLTPYYLVVLYNETSTAGCVVQNMRVWMIDPINSFLLTTIGSDIAGDDTKATTCPADISSANVSTDNTKVTYVYASNNLFYKVTASGVTGTWTPSVRLPALAGLGQNYVSADWAVKGSSTWNSLNLSAGDIDGGDFTSTVTTAPSTVAGSDIIIRLVIANVNYETLTAQAIKIGVDGTMPGNVNDIKTALDCSDAAVFAKEGTFTVTARPEVVDAIPNSPNPTEFIVKNP